MQRNNKVTVGDTIGNETAFTRRILGTNLSVYLPAENENTYTRQRLRIRRCGSADISGNIL